MYLFCDHEDGLEADPVFSDIALAVAFATTTDTANRTNIALFEPIFI
jgi:hypothetical protein